MPILGANLCCKLSYPLRSRLSTLYWLNNNGNCACLNGRAYSSSVLVRYIPKKIRESQTCPSVGSSEEKEASEVLGSNATELRVSRGEDNSQRAFVSGDHSWHEIRNQSEMPENGSRFNDTGPGSIIKQFPGLKEEFDCKVGDYEFEVEPEEDVEEDNFLKQTVHHDRDDIQVDKIKRGAENTVVKLLAARAFTAVELRKKLHSKKFPPNIIERVINDFQDRGLINDSLYAENYSQSRWSSSTWGPKRIKQALLRKGVNKADTEKAVTQVFKEGEPDNQESRFGMSKLSMDHLVVQASKQWLRSQNAPLDTQKARLVRWLQYRGFNWDVIKYTLKRLESQYPLK